MRRVVCGLSVTMETFSPTTRFSSVDFPEFGRPMIETNPDLLMSFRNQSFHTKPLHPAPVRIEDFDLDSAVFDFFARRWQPSEQLDDSACNRCAVGVFDQRHSKFFFE